MDAKQQNRQPKSQLYSWFKASRSVDALELIRKNPNAYALTRVIAHRAWYREGFNADGCGFGEALLGDYNE